MTTERRKAELRAQYERAIRTLPATDSSQDGWVVPLWYWLSRSEIGREAKKALASGQLASRKDVRMQHDPSTQGEGVQP